MTRIILHVVVVALAFLLGFFSVTPTNRTTERKTLVAEENSPERCVFEPEVVRIVHEVVVTNAVSWMPPRKKADAKRRWAWRTEANKLAFKNPDAFRRICELNDEFTLSYLEKTSAEQEDRMSFLSAVDDSDFSEEDRAAHRAYAEGERDELSKTIRYGEAFRASGEYDENGVRKIADASLDKWANTPTSRDNKSEKRECTRLLAAISRRYGLGDGFAELVMAIRDEEPKGTGGNGVPSPDFANLVMELF